MHWKEARAKGQTEQRLYGLKSWEESPYYSDRERAALKWAEAVTASHVPDSIYNEVKDLFSETELIDLTHANNSNQYLEPNKYFIPICSGKL
jgi:alkylhydroperoxidase family enzyme